MNYEDTRVPTSEELTEISQLVIAHDNLAEQIETLELQLTRCKEARRNLVELELPTRMQTCGLRSMVTATGRAVKLRTDVVGSLSAERAPEALQWLRDHEFGDLIKTDIIASFGRGEEKTAQDVLALLNDIAVHPTVKEGVHPSTLKAFVREQLAAGTNVPLDMFGVHQLTKAVIK